VLAVGATTPDLVVTFKAPVADVVLVNTAYVSSTQTDPVPGNESATVSTTVNSCHPELVNKDRSSVSASPVDVPADNASTSRVTVTLRDQWAKIEKGQPAKGQPVQKQPAQK